MIMAKGTKKKEIDIFKISMINNFKSYTDRNFLLINNVKLFKMTVHSY